MLHGTTLYLYLYTYIYILIVRKKGWHFQRQFCWQKILDCLSLKNVVLKLHRGSLIIIWWTAFFKSTVFIQIKTHMTYGQGHFFKFSKYCDDRYQNDIEIYVTALQTWRLFSAGCEVEQVSLRKATYGALDFPRSLESHHAWPEGEWWSGQVRSLCHQDWIKLC